MSVPQPIPYQGSKRRLAPVILGALPREVATLHEPFVGSGALTIAAAAAGRAARYVVGDSLAPLVALWDAMLRAPGPLCDAYEALWTAQLDDPRGYYDVVRERFNREREPAQLLYLVARCVKNAVRFNGDGDFNQSPDKRRLGMKPALLRSRVDAVHALLAGRARAVHRDYAESLREAGAADVVYMDPPYLGVSGTRDARYHQGLDYARFVAELAAANDRGVSYLVSFDGRTGERTYGPGLPDGLGLHRMEIHVGRSSQATLHGRADETVESLYLSPALVARLRAEGVTPTAHARVSGARSGGAS
ncbi:MAG: DNA adenine methylase [Deltaproteobacteria bacterium]|nr:MAG: DNA adenine methylase [Deltaproteobacteria bacterium]